MFYSISNGFNSLFYSITTRQSCSSSLPVVFRGKEECRLFFFFTLLPWVTHAITWNTAKTPWKTHPTQDETENREKAVRLRELTHIWSACMNIYGREPVMQLVFISQYPPKKEVTFTPCDSDDCTRGEVRSASRVGRCTFAPPTYGWGSSARRFEHPRPRLSPGCLLGGVTIAWLVSLPSCQALDRPKVWTPHKQNV